MKKQIIYTDDMVGKTISNVINNGELYVIHLNDNEYVILESEYDSSYIVENTDYYKIDDIKQIKPYLCEELYNNEIINDDEYKFLKEERLKELKKDHENVKLHEINELKRLKLKYPDIA